MQHIDKTVELATIRWEIAGQATLWKEGLVVFRRIQRAKDTARRW
jgi:hypothetical protein